MTFRSSATNAEICEGSCRRRKARNLTATGRTRDRRERPVGAGEQLRSTASIAGLVWRSWPSPRARRQRARHRGAMPADRAAVPPTTTSTPRRRPRRQRRRPSPRRPRPRRRRRPLPLLSARQLRQSGHHPGGRRHGQRLDGRRDRRRRQHVHPARARRRSSTPGRRTRPVGRSSTCGGTTDYPTILSRSNDCSGGDEVCRTHRGLHRLAPLPLRHRRPAVRHHRRRPERRERQLHVDRHGTGHGRPPDLGQEAADQGQRRPYEAQDHLPLEGSQHHRQRQRRRLRRRSVLLRRRLAASSVPDRPRRICFRLRTRDVPGHERVHTLQIRTPYAMVLARPCR